MGEVKPVPEGYRNVTPYLIVSDGAGAIDFYRRVFGATERLRMDAPDGKVGHAELELGDSVVMLADEFPDWGARSPKTVGGSPVIVHVYVDDVDAVVRSAVAAGATVVREVENQFYGDRSGLVEDPFGHLWNVGTHVEDVAPEELRRRAAAAAAG
jgi:PhnB protein